MISINIGLELWLHLREQLQNIVMDGFVRLSPEPHVRSLPNLLCMLPMSVVRSSSIMLMLGRIAYRWEGGDGSAQCGRSVIYDCLVAAVAVWFSFLTFIPLCGVFVRCRDGYKACVNTSRYELLWFEAFCTRWLLFLWCFLLLLSSHVLDVIVECNLPVDNWGWAVTHRYIHAVVATFFQENLSLPVSRHFLPALTVKENLWSRLFSHARYLVVFTKSTEVNCKHKHHRWWFGLAVVHWSWSTRLTYAEPG